MKRNRIYRESSKTVAYRVITIVLVTILCVCVAVVALAVATDRGLLGTKKTEQTTTAARPEVQGLVVTDGMETPVKDISF